HQPSPYRDVMRKGGKIGLAVLAFLLLLTMVMGGGGRPLLVETLPVDLTGTARTATLGPITVTRPYQLVAIRAQVPGPENGWVDLDYALVDRATQTSYQAYGAAERYSGRDSDGAWTEGSRRRTVKLASVPAGTYDLVIDYSGNSWRDFSSAYATSRTGGSL